MPTPEEFQTTPDTYEPVPEMWVDADYYLDGDLIHPARRTQQEPPELSPGWTVQGGGQRGESP
jgi:hypothetical protein